MANLPPWRPPLPRIIQNTLSPGRNGSFQQNNSPYGWPAPHLCVWYQTQWALKQMKMMWSSCKLEISEGQRRPEPTSVHLQDQISSSQVRDLPRDGNFCCDGGKMSQSIFSCYLGETATTVSSNRASGFSGSTAPPPGWCGCSAPVEIRQRGGKINTPEWISYINCTEILPSVTYRVSI